MYKIQPIKDEYKKSGNLKFRAPFKNIIQTREGLTNFDIPVSSVLYPKKERIKQEIKSVHIGYSD